jgi:hypothetical protein
VKTLATLLILSFWIGLPANAASAYTIELNGYDDSQLASTARQYDDSGGGASYWLYQPSFPYLNTSSAVDGGASSVSVFDLSLDGFDISFVHSNIGPWTGVDRSFGEIFFRVSQDIGYLAAGSYSSLAGEGRAIFLAASLYDHTLGAFLFDSYQESTATPYETFVPGQNGGDNENTSSGSLAGMLIAGHDYEFYYNATVSAAPYVSPNEVAAFGNISLSFIPEPSTALLLGLGLVGLGVRRRELRCASAAN